ncbi:MAG: 30S ribosomal protein S27e [Halobacteriales archaeon]|nr:30S ribosomal protein S27e [Halobacteriales archaeon]
MTQPKTESKYRRVKCGDCGNEQILFLRAATAIKCQVCGATMAEPTGGLARLRGEIVGTVE